MEVSNSFNRTIESLKVDSIFRVAGRIYFLDVSLTLKEIPPPFHRD